METKTLTRLTVGEMLTTCSLKVKIGSREGGGFVFCGNVAEVDLVGIDREIIDDMKASRSRAQREITYLKNRPKDFETFVSEMERKRKQYARKLGGGQSAIDSVKEEFPTSPEAHKKWKQGFLDNLKKAQSRKRKLDTEIKKFKSIGHRKIIDAYESIDEKDTTIVIFEGHERGSYWTTKEYVTGIVEHDDGWRVVRPMTNAKFIEELLKEKEYDQAREVISRVAEDWKKARRLSDDKIKQSVLDFLVRDAE